MDLLPPLQARNAVNAPLTILKRQARQALPHNLRIRFYLELILKGYGTLLIDSQLTTKPHHRTLSPIIHLL